VDKRVAAVSSTENKGEKMIIHTVELTVVNVLAEQFYEFMINPTDEAYSAWWPGEHLRFHIVKHGDKDHLGDLVFMDERLGKNHRLVFSAVVIKALRPRSITWQMKKAGLRLPAVVMLELHDSSEGIQLKHELRIGFAGVGRILDPFIKLYFNKSFQTALDDHCKIEWDKLASFLNQSKTEG
jgi:hypothetical protein